MIKEFIKQLRITLTERKKYALPKIRDLEILAKCKYLEKLRLTKQDKESVAFIKTQLEYDWRKPLLKRLNRLLKKYKQRY